MASPDTIIKKGTCAICSSRCGTLVYVQNGKVVRVEGDTENPLGRGRLCPKTATSIDFHNHPSRLNFPLKRTGDRGEGKWARISWEEALDEIADKIEKIKKQHGPEAVAFMGGGASHEPGDWAAWRWCNLFGTPNMHNQGKNCAEAENLAECATYGYHTFPAPRPGVTRCVVIWGGNPAASNPTLVWRDTLEAKKRGAKLIVIDPRPTEPAKKADLWLRLRPGTDGAMGLGMLNVIIRENLYDAEFVRKYCLGFDQIKALAEQYTPEETERITWVPAEKIVEAARSMATLRPGVIPFGVATGQLGRAGKSAVQVKAILRAVTGNLDIEGGNLLRTPLLSIDWHENLHWEKLLEHPERTRDTISAGTFPIASIRGYRLFREAMKNVYPQGYGSVIYMLTYSGVNLWRAVLDEKPYPVRAVISQGANPMCSLDTQNAYRAFKSPNLELHVGMEFFMTPTVALADYVFPAADVYERSSLNFRWGLVDYYAGADRCVPPLHERRDDYQLWRGLGNRLGQEGYWPDTVEEMYDRFLRPSGKTFREFISSKEPWNSPPEDYRRYEREGFATFSGKVELVPSIFEKLGIEALPRFEEPARSPLSTPELAKEYPFVLITGARTIFYQHSRFREQPRLRKACPDPLLEINPGAAAELGIAEGDWVIIETPEGRIRQRASLNAGIDPRVVSADGYWWFPERSGEEPELFGVWESCANVLVPGDPESCDYSGNHLFRGLLCKVYKE